MSAPQSLPSFAQAFSVISPESNALPPILRQTLRNDQRPRLRKRPRADSAVTRDDDSYSSSDRGTPPRVSFIKEEQDYDQLDSTSPPHAARSKHLHSSRHDTANATGAPPPSLARPSMSAKKRRITISGAAQPLNTTNLEPAHPHPHPHTGPSTPISPVVIGFPLQRDDPQVIEQVRAMLSVKQKQKALIESRRGSTAGLADGRRPSAAGNSDGRRASVAGVLDGRRGSNAGLAPSVNIVNPTPTSATAPPGAAPAVAGPKRSGPSPGGSRRGRTPSSSNSLPPHSVPSNVSLSPKASAIGPGNAAAPGPRAVSPLSHIVPSQIQRPLPHRSPPSVHTSAQNQAHAAAPQSQSQSQSQPHPQPQLQSQPQSQPPTQPYSQSQSHAQQTQLSTQGLSALANALPPPPTSFARRRAGQLGLRGNKPADIVISPRDADAGVGLPRVAQAHGGGGRGSVSYVSSYSYKALQPAVQSAPPVPRPGQQPGRFPLMALPSLPPALSQQQASGAGAGATVPIAGSRRTATGQVPPTPTRLGSQQRGPPGASVRLSQPTGSSGPAFSPPMTSMPATATLQVPGGSVGAHAGAPPGTPATLHRAANTHADKAAFLAPFEQFYDALADARVLKGWFGEQLARVGRLAREAEAQRAELDAARADVERQRAEVERVAESATGMQTRVERWIEDALARERRGAREEMGFLRRRVTELECALWARARAGDGAEEGAGAKGKGGVPPRVNGVQQPPQQHPYPIAPGVDSYTFPPVQPPGPQPPSATSVAPPHAVAPELARRTSSPARLTMTDRDHDAPSHRRSLSRSLASSPAPIFESGRRLSVSAMRYEPQAQPQQRPPSEPDASPRLDKSPRIHRASAHQEGGDAKGKEKENDVADLKRHNSRDGVSNATLSEDGSSERNGAGHSDTNRPRDLVALPPSSPGSRMDES